MRRLRHTSVRVMVDVVELVDTPDCGSGAAALRVQVSSSTPQASSAYKEGFICEFGGIFSKTVNFMEEWPSGLRHRLGKAARVIPPQVRILFLPPYAGVAQRSMALVSKTSVRKHHVGSNPNHPCQNLKNLKIYNKIYLQTGTANIHIKSPFFVL